MRVPAVEVSISVLREILRPTSRAVPCTLARWLTLAGLACSLSSGCTMLETAGPAAQPSALSWLTNWVSQPLETGPVVDIESIRPAPRPPAVAAGNLLEVTVWDLYEPGKPYTYPVRVSPRNTIEVPLLGEVPVEARPIGSLEAALADGFRRGEFLVNPRVLVRSLDAPTIKVQVDGAVARTGFVELSRTDASVYAALVSAGGFKKTAGTQVAVTRRAAEVPPPVAEQSAPAVAAPGPAEQRLPAQRANSLQELSVPAESKGGPAAGQTAAAPDDATTWYDLTIAHDRDRLRALVLGEGDTVMVKAATLPLRIGGVVNRPGAYPLPVGRSLNVWQAIELAEGIRLEDVPLNITLLRAAGDGRGARKWFLSVPHYDQHPAASPLVEPGDVLHVEPTTGSKIKRAVGDLWNKP